VTEEMVWSLISILEGRQYGGNDGYADDPTSSYRYDSRVPNHKRLKSGDVVFIRGASDVIGAARINNLRSWAAEKLERRCPTCKSTKLRKRITIVPPWRCGACSADFEAPTEVQVAVQAYEVSYGSSYVAAPAGVPVALLKSASPAPNDQHSIERLDPRKLEQLLASRFPEALSLLELSAAGATLDPDDGAGADVSADGYKPSVRDERQRVLAEIRRRRGQASFRKRLLARYGARCMLSGCELMDIVEAAHVSPYLGSKDHHMDNGLLLRADLHTLFDLGLLAFRPADMVAKFAPAAKTAGYESLDGASLQVGAKGPSFEALQTRWNEYLHRFGMLEA
jgi:putative restriction endonuclease